MCPDSSSSVPTNQPTSGLNYLIRKWTVVIHLDSLVGVGCTLSETSNPSSVANFFVI